MTESAPGSPSPIPSSAKRKYSVSSQGDEDIISPASQRKKQKKRAP